MRRLRPSLAWTSGALGLVLGIVPGGIVGVATVQGYWMELLGAATVALLYSLEIPGRGWRGAFIGLLLYVPFAGVVTLVLYPWTPALVLKDVLFVLPAYIGFLAWAVTHRESLRGLPAALCSLMIILTAVVLAQMANPGVADLPMGLIGLKIWLFYLLLFVLAFAFVASVQDLFRLFRLLVVLAVVPSAIGVIEAISVHVGDYEFVMRAIYGEMAAPITQGFRQFDIGAGKLARIPSTFTFVFQFFCYTLAMLVPCYALWRRDPSSWWRRLAGGALVVTTLASFLSGARYAFASVPLLLGLMLALDRGIAGLARGVTYTACVLFAALAILGIGGGALYEHVAELGVDYAEGTAYGSLMQALVAAPLGAGTGTSTGAARHAFGEPDASPESYLVFENYYAKAAYELGVPGLLVVIALYLALGFVGFRSHRLVRTGPLRACSAALVSFLLVVMLMGLKGYLIDLDPINVYFWIFAGVLAKLPLLELRRQGTKCGGRDGDTRAKASGPGRPDSESDGRAGSGSLSAFR